MADGKNETTDPGRYRLAAVFFSDIVGYSRLMGENERRTLGYLDEYRRIFGEQIRSHGGEVIEYVGDGIFARFDSSLSAVEAGVEALRALDVVNAGLSAGNPPLQARVGIHVGDVISRDGKIIGDDVNIAARLQGVARPQTLCISGQVYEQAHDRLELDFVELGPQFLKNIRQEIGAWLVYPSQATRGDRMRLGLASIGAHLRSNWIAATAAVLLLAAGAGWSLWQRQGAVQAYYLAVEPFKNLTPKAMEDYYSEGIREAITAQLSGIEGLYLVDASEGIGAPYTLKGSVQRNGDKLRVSYRVVRKKDGSEFAGNTSDGTVEAVFQLQDAVARDIGSSLARQLGLRRSETRPVSYTTDIGAYDFYLQGRDYLRRPRTVDNLDNAIRLFQTALDKDEKFARAAAGLCDAYWERYEKVRDERFVLAAEKACRQALALDPSLPEVHVALGVIANGRGRLDEAEKLLERAITLDPKSDVAVAELADIYQRRGDVARAEQTLKRAIQIDPGYWRGYNRLARFYWTTGRYHESEVMFRKVLQITPDNSVAYLNLSGIVFLQGSFKAALEAAQTSIRLKPDAWAYSNLGTIQYYSGHFEEAKNSFEKAISLSSHDYRWWLNLAEAQMQIPAIQAEARTSLSRAIAGGLARLKVDPLDSECFRSLALAHALNGDAVAARKSLERARELAPEDPDYYYTAARVWNLLGERKKARAEVKDALAVGYPRAILEATPELRGLIR